MYVEHQMIVPESMEERQYQKSIYESALKRSTLVVLPTGLGKTVIAAMLIAETLRTKKGKILFLAPTKPLVEQHARFIRKHIVCEPPAVFTGEMQPAKRKKLWEDSQVIAATPQVISNDIISGTVDLKDVSLIIFDEAHRAVGEYAYVYIGERYREVTGGLVMGMTASPGNNPQKILEVCGHLGIQGVEIRHEYDPDVVKYVHDIFMKWMEVEVPKELMEVIRNLKKALDDETGRLKRAGYLKTGGYVTNKDLLAARRVISGQLQAAEKSGDAYQAATTVAIAMKISHALELAETQGVAALKAYFERLVKEAVSRGASRASKETIALPKVQMAMKAVNKLEAASIESPKLVRVKKLAVAQLNQKPDSKIIVFTHYRDTSEMVAKALVEISIIRPVRFVGQSSRGEDKGMNQKKQVDIIDRFQSGEFNVLVATSVAEEGLDIPSTDLVIFYEPVPSEIRSIQRRGRTGRNQAGMVVVLVSKGTRDEAYRWSAFHKENKMHRELEKLRKELGKKLEVGEPSAPVFRSAEKVETAEPELPKPDIKLPPAGQKTLGEFGKAEKAPEKLRIIADTREFNSAVVKHLSVRDIIIESKQLDVGDYIISDRVGVERKEVDDFVASVMDGRLFQQVKALKRAYQAPLIIIEGKDLYSGRLSADSLRGVLASIAVDFGVPMMFTADDRGTAEFLLALAKREAADGRTPGIRGEKGSMLIQERQQFILEGFPNVSGVMAQRLLAHFGSVEAVLSATEEQLMEVKGVGKKIAAGIRQIVESKYFSEEKDG